MNNFIYHTTCALLSIHTSTAYEATRDVIRDESEQAWQVVWAKTHYRAWDTTHATCIDTTNDVMWAYDERFHNERFH